MKPACVRAGYGDKPPKMSIVALLCDFGQASLSDCADQCIEGLRTHAPPDAELIFVANGPSNRLRDKLLALSSNEDRIIAIILSKRLPTNCNMAPMAHETHRAYLS